MSDINGESSSLKSTCAQATAKTTSCDKKLANSGPRGNLSLSKIHNEMSKDPRSSYSSTISQNSTSKNKINEFNGRVASAVTKCNSTSGTPILSRIQSSNKFDNMGLISPSKTRKTRDVLDIFPSGNSSRWWEVLLPLKRETNEGRSHAKELGNCKDSYSKVQSDKVKNSQKETKDRFNEHTSKLDALRVKENLNHKSSVKK